MNDASPGLCKQAEYTGWSAIMLYIIVFVRGKKTGLQMSYSVLWDKSHFVWSTNYKIIGKIYFSKPQKDQRSESQRQNSVLYIQESLKSP